MIEDEQKVEEPENIENQPEAEQLASSEWNTDIQLPVTQGPEVMSPLSFAFSAAEQKSAFNFPNVNNDNGEINGLLSLAAASEQVAEELEKKCQSNSEECSSQELGQESEKPSLEMEVVVEGGQNSSDEGSTASLEEFEPKSHVGWASFGDTIVKPTPTTKPKSEHPVEKRKIYVVRSQNQLKNKKYLVSGNIDTLIRSQETAPILSKNLPKPEDVMNQLSPKRTVKKPRIEEEEEVDVVGFTPEKQTEDAFGADDSERYLEMDEDSNSVSPPDLPPQRPQSSRFEKQRMRKDLVSRRLEDEEPYYRKRTRFLNSPPPCLERQTDDVPTGESMTVGPGAGGDMADRDNMIEFGDEDMDVEDEEVIVDDVPDDDPKMQQKTFFEHNPNQLLKTKISTSSIPILPMSKCIMERKKVAVEKTKHALTKRVSANKSAKINNAVAPKMYQIPAYTDRSPVTYYTNTNKTPATAIRPKDYSRGGCYRCADNSYFSVDMSTFKFTEETTAVSVRAHLCDQTRVMIARTALWNREYARKLGDRAAGTLWQKPDEVTAQMTGFCSATVKRCIEIANLSMVPKCSDRIGVSKPELAQLKTAFSDDPKFCDHPMRSPHVLNQYYQLKQGSQTMNVVKKPSMPPSLDDSYMPNMLDPANRTVTSRNFETNLEKDRRNEVAGIQRRPFQGSQPPPLPAKRTVLRWSTIQSTGPPKYTIGQSSSTRPPLMKAVIPVKVNTNEVVGKKVVYKGPPAKPDEPTLRRGRGRPKKEKEEDEYMEEMLQAKIDVMKKVQQRFSKRLPKKGNDIEETVKEVVQRMVDAVVIEHNLD